MGHFLVVVVAMVAPCAWPEQGDVSDLWKKVFFRNGDGMVCAGADDGSSGDIGGSEVTFEEQCASPSGTLSGLEVDVPGDFDENFPANSAGNSTAKFGKKMQKNLPRSRNGSDPSPREEVRKMAIGDVDAAWETVPGGGQVVVASESYENPLWDRVNRVRIPRVRFIDTPLSRAVEALSVMAGRNDCTDEAGSTVNMVVIGRTAGPEEPLINLNLSDISLYRLIELVAKSANYQFDIAEDAVIFYGQGMVDDLMETRCFPVSRPTLVRLIGSQRDGEESSQSSATTEEVERCLGKFFRRSGINLQDVGGGNIAFDGSQIIVTGTWKNLKKIERILKKYSTVKQVEIITKFLEVQQGVLDELGMRWTIGSRNKPDNSFLRTGITQEGKESDSLRTLSEAFASSSFSRGNGRIVLPSPASPVALTNQPPGLPGQLNLGVDSGRLSNFTGVLNSLQCNLLVQALEQHSGSDLMSAPRVTVLSGKTAEIIIAMEMRYPQKYGDTRSEVGVGSSAASGTNSAGVTITAGTPQDFVTRNVGVEMKVTPIVEADGTISLRLEPKVTEFEGFVEYGGMSVAVSSGITVTVPSGFYQPIFSTREVRTEVNIADGATVVMGGLTREEVKEVHDKVPILGDIPLIGLLFRSKSTTTQKRNLLIFVTAHTISPCGDKAIPLPSPPSPKKEGF